MQDVESHIDFLFEGLDGFVYVPTKSNGEWTANFFAYPSARQELVDFIVTAGQECDVYVAPTIFKEKSAKKKSVKATQVVWVEYDGQEPAKLIGLPTPSRIVQSSLDTHFHIYWKVGPQNAQTIEDLNRRLTYFLEADSSGWDINQVLRPPGTYNYKRNLPVRIKSVGSSSYSPTDFDAIPQVDRPVVTYLPTSLPEAEHLIAQLPKKLVRLIEDTNVQEPHRSGYLFRLGQELAEYGLPELAIVSLLLHSDNRIGKFKGRDDQIVRLSEIAALSVFKHTNEEAAQFYSPFELLELDEELEFFEGLEGVLPKNGQLILTGAPSVGKTQYALNMAMSLCNNYRVGVLSLEMSNLEIKYVLKHQVKALPAASREAYRNNVWITCPDELKWVDVEDMLDENPVDILMVDSISEIMQGDSPEDYRELMRWLRKVRRKTQTAMILIHHNRKATGDNKKPNKLSDLYGSYLLAAKSDSVLCMWETGEKNKIELFGLKLRFGQKVDKPIWRNTETLTFTEIQPTTEKTNGSKPGQQLPDKTGTVGPLNFHLGIGE